MITIVHGEDVLSQKKYRDDIILKNKGREIITLEGKTLDETNLTQALESKSLFGEDKIVILENPNILKNIVKKIIESKIDVYIFFEKQLGHDKLSLFPKAQIVLFKPKAIIFDFLESLRPGNTKVILKLFENAAAKEETELVFYMLIRQFRNLILVKDISWTQEISPWQKSKLASQCKYFDLRKLLEIYQKLLQIDYENKTGQNALDLKKTLELFLLRL